MSGRNVYGMCGGYDIAAQKSEGGCGVVTYGATMLSSFLLRMGSDMLTDCCRWESVERRRALLVQKNYARPFRAQQSD